MAAEKILVPYNFTVNDEKSLDYVIQKYAGNPEVEITLFHAYVPVPEIDTRNSPIMEKVVRNTYYLKQNLRKMEDTLKEARMRLSDKGIPSRLVTCLFKPVERDIGHDIVRLVKSGNYNRVILNRNPGNIVGYFTRSISKLVSQRAGKDVNIFIVN